MMRLLPWVVSTLVGLAGGVGGYTFIYAKGASYLKDDPAACANCHVMSEQLAGWNAASHRAAAVCNDCHTPPGVVSKYLTKASNGFWHSFAFTTGRFPDPIRITPGNRRVTERACQKCHEDIVEAINGGYAHAEPRSCITCHLDVGHLR